VTTQAVLLEPRALTNERITDELLGKVITPPRWVTAALVATALGALWFFAAIGYTVFAGIGVWGNNIPVAWAFGITNFVWWIGIGHAGTFISAFLLLLEQKWRTSINRFAEAMTLFAVIQAGLFPALHLGRPWFAYWLVPYPSEMRVWPQFRSALPWDFAAVSTYFTVSLLFWYLGLVPDLAALRDRAPSLHLRRIYGVFALGWHGSACQWSRYRVAYGLLGGIATPLVVSVHSVVSTDFAISLLPGWHSTIFPPYFVAGAIYSGFAMVVMLMLPARRLWRFANVVTDAHFDKMAKLLLVTGSIVAYSYLVEAYQAWTSGDEFERFLNLGSRTRGPFAWSYWTVLACNCVTPQLFWFRRFRRSPLFVFFASVVIQLGMWLERFMLIVSSLAQDFLPSAWTGFRPTFVDLSLLLGSMSFFLFLFLLFMRFVPFIPVSEVKHMRHEILKEEEERAHA
jgi:molybdopterin-containing oxidoreductase family membrane subunit